MKKVLLPALLLLASTAHATVTNYHWTGTVDSGNVPETTVSGSFTTDDSAPINPDESNNLATTFDGGLKNVSLHIGSGDYGFPVWSYVVPSNGGALSVGNCPLSGGPLAIDDLNLDSNNWSVFYGHDGTSDTIFGKVTALFSDPTGSVSSVNDAAPTPEPSSLVLMGAGLLGFFFYRVTRSRLKA